MVIRFYSRAFILFFILSCVSSGIFSQEVNKALDLFLNNKMNESLVKLTEICNNPNAKERGKAGVALALIHKLNENADDKVKYYVEGLKYLQTPDPYAYTLWGDCGFYNYPKYAKEILTLYANRKNIHPDINYCLDLLKARLLVRNEQYDSLLAFNAQRGCINQWEFLGAFDYMDGYGFNNDEQTLSHPEATYEFRGKYNTPIKWFPILKNSDAGSLLLNEYVELYNYSSAKMYAQTFLKSDAEQDIHLTIICGMDVKCWVNDMLVYENRKNIENIGGLPFHIPVRLQKGNNRILFQLGLKGKYATNFEVYYRNPQDQPMTGITAQTTDKVYTKQANKIAAITDPEIESFNVQAFTDYLKSHPNDILEQMLRMEELNSTGDKVKTLKALAGLYEKYPNSYYLSNMYYNNKENINYSTKDEYLNQKCESCYSALNKKLSDAIDEEDKTAIKESLEKLDKQYPDNISVLYSKIDYHLGENEYTQAEKLIEEGAARYENYLVFNNYKSMLLYNQAKKKEAIAFLKSILPARNNTFVSERLKSIYIEENDTTNWVELQKKDMIYDKSDENYNALLAIYNDGKKYDLSEKTILEFLEKKPYSGIVWEHYGDLMTEKGDKARALEYYLKSYEYYPMNYEVRKKINTSRGLKPEVEVLLPQTMKEVYQQARVNKIETPQALKSRNWITLYKKSASVMYESGLNTLKYYIFYKILNEAGINDFKELSTASFGTDVMIFKEDGQIVLPETNLGTLVLPNLKPGDIVGMKSQTDYVSVGEYISTRYKNFITNVENEPLVILEEENLVSKGVKAEPVLYDDNKLLHVEKKDWDKDFYMYKVTAKNPLYIEPELAPTNLLLNTASFVIQNYNSWDEVSKWYWEIASPTLVADDNLKKLTKDLLKGNENASQYVKAKLIYKWITTNINYSSQSFRQDNYVPQMPAKLVQDKLGDCKDLSALFIVMCREAGIRANFCLVNMEKNAGLYRSFPNINFNHCIAKVYTDNTPLYVELTSNNAPFAQTMLYAAYGYGLEIDPGKTAVINDLYNEGHCDVFVMHNKLNVVEDKLNLKGTVKLCGIVSILLEDGVAKLDSSQVNSTLQIFISSLLPNGNFSSCTYNKNENNITDTLKLSYEITNNDIYTNVADMHVYKLPPFLNKIASDAVFANANRKTDLSLLTSMSMINESSSITSIDIPANMKLFKKPENQQITNPYFDYSLVLSEANNELNITRSFKVKTKVIPVKDFAAYKAEMDKAYKIDLVTVVLQ